MSEAAAFALSQMIYAATTAYLFVKYYNAGKRAAAWEAESKSWKADSWHWHSRCEQLETQLRELAKEPK